MKDNTNSTIFWRFIAFCVIAFCVYWNWDFIESLTVLEKWVIFAIYSFFSTCVAGMFTPVSKDSFSGQVPIQYISPVTWINMLLKAFNNFLNSQKPII